MGEALASADELLDAARSHERRRVDEYRRLLELVAGRSEGLEAFARAQIAAEERVTAGLPSKPTPVPETRHLLATVEIPRRRRNVA